MIILEGFDNSGKSTLAQEFKLEIVHPGPAPRTSSEERSCLEAQLHDARLPIVMDRVTCISSQIYKNKLLDSYYMDYLNRMLDTPGCILIYCRPSLLSILDFSGHKPKAYDTVENTKRLRLEAEQHVMRYDALMKVVPCMVYNWSKPDKTVIQEAIDCQFIYSEWKKCTNTLKRMQKHF